MGMIAIATIASTAFSAFGAMREAQAQKEQYNYQRQVAENNAVIARQNATAIRQRMEVAEEEQRERVAATKGAARARLAANGLLVDDTEDSTAVGLIADIAEAGEYDILKLRYNYEQEARAAEIQGINYDAQAGLFQLQADSVPSGAMAAAGSLLSSAGRVQSAGKEAGWWS